jgi:hypothetical protein
VVTRKDKVCAVARVDIAVMTVDDEQPPGRPRPSTATSTCSVTMS